MTTVNSSPATPPASTPARLLEALGIDPRPVHGVAFDMDGTLIDSEPTWFVAMAAVAPSFGTRLPPEASTALHGLDRASSSRLLTERFGLQGDVDRYWVEVLARLEVELAHAQPMRNAPAWVQATTRAGLPAALVTNSPRSVMHASLAPHPWAEQLQVRIAIEDVPRGKPHPDPYLLAAERLAVDPGALLVVEDSVAGATAAVAAGATCVFVTHGIVAEEVARGVTPWVVEELPDTSCRG